MKSPRILALSVTLALSLGIDPIAYAETTLPEGMVAGPSIEGISEYRLANGLQVLLFADASKPTVTVNLVYGVGSVDENYGETGMAHLLEHLMFKGTPSHADISGEMKKRGIEFNATTAMDRTNYFSSFPANEATLQWLLAMEADRMVGSNIAKADLDSEMTVVRNELESGENNPVGVLLQRIRSSAYLWHNYGNSTIGVRSDVEGVPIENLQAFYRRWYQPDNATLIIAGRIDPTSTLQQIATEFGPIQKPSRRLPKFHTREPAQDGERQVTVRRAGDLQVVAAAYHVPAAGHPDSAALSVLADIIGHSPGGRLHKALVETQLAAGAGAGDEAMHDPGLMTVLAVMPKQADADKTQSVLLAQVEDIAARPVTQQEVDEAKQRIANAYELYFTDVNAVGIGLSESLAAGDWRLLFTGRDAIAGVTVEDVNRVAASYLKSSNRTLGRFVPSDGSERVQISARPDIATLVEGYTGGTVVSAGEAFDPSPQNIEARTQTWVIGDGLKVALLPKQTRGNTVLVNANFRFGNAQALRGREDAAGLAGAMLLRGSQSLDRQQIDKRFEALKTQASIGGNLQGASIGLQTRREQLADALALAADILRHPAFPKDEFEQLKLQALTGLEAQRQDPSAVAGIALARHFDPWPVGHPLHVQTLDESIATVKALTVEDLRRFHHDFYGTTQGEISIVGDFDPDAVKVQLQALFADWKPAVAYAPIDTRYHAVAPSQQQLQTVDKPNAVLLAQHNLPLNVTSPDYPALMIANRILGGSPLKSRLGDRIRQQEGLSYGVVSGISADDSLSGVDDNGSLKIQAIAAPQNMARLETALREELQRFIDDGITADELRDAVSGTLTEREQARADDASIAAILGDHLFYDRSMQFTSDMDARFKALTVEQVNAAIRQYLHPDQLSVVVAGDFSKLGAGP